MMLQPWMEVHLRGFFLQTVRALARGFQAALRGLSGASASSSETPEDLSWTMVENMLVSQLCYEIGEEIQKIYVWAANARAGDTSNSNKYVVMIQNFKWFSARDERLNEPGPWIDFRTNRNTGCHLQDMEEKYGRFACMLKKGILEARSSGKDDSATRLLTFVPELFKEIISPPRLILLACAVLYQLPMATSIDHLLVPPETTITAWEQRYPWLSDIAGGEWKVWGRALLKSNAAFNSSNRYPAEKPNLHSILTRYRAGKDVGAYNGFLSTLPDLLPFRDAEAFGTMFRELPPRQPAMFVTKTSTPTNRKTAALAVGVLETALSTLHALEGQDKSLHRIP